jgi:aryl-alcohol dehydrogenase-like predicted oxidoreductase
MEYITLGRSQREVSRIGLGGMAFGNLYGPMERIDVIRTIHQAIDLGITYFDSSPSYGEGRAEELLGDALGSHLDRVFIANKVWSGNAAQPDAQRSNDRDAIVQRLDASRRRLRREWIDLYHVYGHDPYTPMSITMEAMQEVREQGKITFIGTCETEPGHLRSTVRYGKLDAVENPYNIFNRSAEYGVIPFARATGMSLMVGEPFCCGLLHGHLRRHSSFDQGDRRILDRRFRGDRYRTNVEIVNRLRSFAEQEGLTMTQLSLGWLLQNPAVGVVICGAKSPRQIKEIVAAGTSRLSPEQMSGVDQIVGNVLYEQPA